MTTRSCYENEQQGEKVVDVRPERSFSVKWSSHGIGTNTQFSGLGSTPTGELDFLLKR